MEDIQKWYSGLDYDQWFSLPPLSSSSATAASPPSARYKHAAAVVDGKLYISGGSRNGRYLSDLHVFDLTTWEWSNLNLQLFTSQDLDQDLDLPLPPLSGHNMIPWRNKLLLLSSHSKSFSSSQYVTLCSIDLETHHHALIKTLRHVPIAREGSSITVFGSKLIMFGGEDVSRHLLLNDIHVLDLNTMMWDLVQTKNSPPAPRFDHTATLHAERYLIIFGGCSHATCFNDLYVLDLESMEWSQPHFQGDVVSPRAGHSGISIGEYWYIVGGGDSKSGASETLVLNMSKLVWSVITTVKERDPLASEGITVCSSLIEGEKYLVSFGGYNGKYNNEVFIMRPKRRDSTRPKILQSPAAAAAAASVRAAYALTISGKLESNEAVRVEEDLRYAIDSRREEKKVLEVLVEEVRSETENLRQRIDEYSTTYAELSKELDSVQGQLISERSRCTGLEAQIVELEKVVSSLPAVEKEVELLRQQKTAYDEVSDASVRRQGSGSRSGGVWGWIAGSA